MLDPSGGIDDVLTRPASLAPGLVTEATPPLQVNPSKLQAVAITMALALTATMGGATTLLHFARDRDIAGAVEWVQSSGFVAFFTGLATLGSLAGLGWRTFKRKATEIYLAYHSKDRIAVVKVSAPPAPPPSL